MLCSEPDAAHSAIGAQTEITVLAVLDGLASAGRFSDRGLLLFATRALEALVRGAWADVDVGDAVWTALINRIDYLRYVAWICSSCSSVKMRAPGSVKTETPEYMSDLVGAAVSQQQHTSGAG